MNRTLTISFLAVALLGCGAPATPADKPPPATKPALTSAGGTFTAKGDVAPQEYGPLTLDGRYEATFTQQGSGVDFRREVPFTAHLEDAGATGAPKRTELFETAARQGRKTFTARGRLTLLVDFGDSPFTVEITRLPR